MGNEIDNSNVQKGSSEASHTHEKTNEYYVQIYAIRAIRVQ